MKIGYNWLREFVDISMGPAELADSLTMLGFLATNLGSCEPRFQGVLCGEVLGVMKHPQADRLVLCSVFLGDRNLSVVCGATNVKKGMKVPVACVGSVLPNGTKIARAVIRGQVSEGMLCSGAELELSEDASGIMGLPDESVPGRALDEELGLSETVIDVEVGYNRPDCLSVFGLAREISASTGAPLRLPEIKTVPAAPLKGEEVPVEIEDASDCPRYCGLVLGGVLPKSSPLWLRRRLEIAGFRSLNSVVDSTNYCLATFGQPIHAFDLDRMRRKAILVRRATTGETIVTLDGTKRLLGPDVLAITDGEAPIALAGIMGGEETEVVDSSRRVFLESALFSQHVVKRGAARLGLESEASRRFSRGIDGERVRWCLEFVGSLITALSGGSVKGKAVEAYPEKLRLRSVSVRPARIDALLGGGISTDFMKQKLENLGFGWEQKGDQVDVRVPSFRHDVYEEVDIAEEVARSFGYDRFAERGANLSWVPGVDEEEEVFFRKCRDASVALGLSEVMTRTLVDPRKAELFVESAAELVPLANPASSEEAVLRPSVFSSLLETVSLNLRRGSLNLRLFEVGKAFRKGQGQSPSETWYLAGAITGSKRPASWQDPRPEECDFFDVRGVSEGLLAKLKIDNPEWLCYDGRVVEKEVSSSICCDGKLLGLLGKVNRQVLEAYDIERDVYVFQLDTGALRACSAGRHMLIEPSRFPPVKRDLAVVVEDGFPQARAAALIEELGGDLLRRLELFDLYRGEAIGKGRKSLAYSLSFQSDERTLSDSEVEDIVLRIIAGLAEKGVSVRGKSFKVE